MRHKFLLIALFTSIMACQRPGTGVTDTTKARSVTACTFVTLSGNITSNTTLNAANTYLISGIVVVKSPATLTIPAGTVLQGVKSISATAWLVVEKGAKLVATGTSSNPVVFTSDQAPGSRAAGDWGGIAFAGQATNNNSNLLDIPLSGSYTLSGGGTNDLDNSGSLQYVQLHFAGAGFSNDPSKSALLFNSVGSGTTVDHIQVTNSKYDGMSVFGGTTSVSNVYSYNQGRTDFPVSFGYRGNMQFMAAMRPDKAFSPIAAAYGMDISNNPIPVLCCCRQATARGYQFRQAYRRQQYPTGGLCLCNQ
ncbi:hypothetical protein [Taibaiella helva]|uniref:hypothetical protein n=1 Tax=Taibaiella helva TaxID=2301235 RepID=UPI000E57E5ED|nr:hypothetical protein [Taibaiella helva]